MDAMRALWNGINQNREQQAPPVESVARSAELRASFERLRAEGSIWLGSPGQSDFVHARVVTQLATAMQNAVTTSDQLRVLSTHHQEHGGGRRWFRVDSGKLVPLLAHNDIMASDYRFRLRSLCKLAAQCGVATTENALNAMAQEALDDEEKDYS